MVITLPLSELLFVLIPYIVLSLIIAYVIFKEPYIKLKNFYKKHLYKINLLLPYYLKSLEILIQHYTVPVALSKSIATAPEIFKDGLIFSNNFSSIS